MAYSDILVDTSIIIEFLRKPHKEDSQLYTFMERYCLYTSSVIEFELRAGALNIQKQQQVDKVLSIFTVISFSSQISQEAATIYQQLKKNNELIEIRDIFIAATAITHAMLLATLNKKHFERIAKLQLY